MVTARDMPNARVEVAFDTATWRTRPAEGEWTRVDVDRNTLDLGPTASNASTSDHASFDVTDLDVRIKVALADWTPATAQVLLSRFNALVSNGGGYQMVVNATTGIVRLRWSTGAANLLADSTVAPTVADGAELWLRVTLDVNNGAAGYTVTFYTSTDATDDHSLVTWTQLGAAVTVAGVTSIGANALNLVWGTDIFGSNPVTGDIFAAAVLDGIGGTVVTSPVFAEAEVGDTTLTDAQGRVYTLAGAAAIEAVWTGCPLRHLTAERGARLKVAEVESGTATSVIDNRSRNLDPSNTSSAWAPNVRPRRRIRYVLEPEGEDDIVAHTGFVERFPLAWEVGDHTVDITSTDLLALIGEEPLPESVHHWTVADLGAVLHWPMADDAGSVMEDVIGTRDGAYRLGAEGGIDVVPYAKGGARFSAYSSGNRKVPQATLDAGLLNLPADFSISTWFQAEANYPDGVTGALYDIGLFQQDGFFDGLGSSAPYIYFLVFASGEFRGVPRFYIGNATDFQDFLPNGGVVDLLDGAPHHILATVDGTNETITVYVDGVALTQGGTVLSVGSWPALPTDTTTLIGNNSNVEWASFDAASQVETSWKVGHVSVYESVLTAADAVTLYESGALAWSGDRTGERLGRVLDTIGVDADDRSIATGSQVCGPTLLGGTLAEYISMLVSTEQGTCYVDGDGRITFTERPENDPTPVYTFAGNADDGVPYTDVEPDYSLDRIVNDVTVTREVGLPQRSTNEDSATEWGTVPADFTTGHLSASGARATGARITIRNGDPRLVFPGLDLAMRRADVPIGVASLALGEAVTVIANPTPDGTPISQLSLVERIEMELDWQAEKDWRLSLGVTEHTVLPFLAWDTPGSGWNESVWND